MKARENPFRSERLDALRYRLGESEWERMLERLDTLGGRGALVGPQGTGKSTMLREVGGRLEARGIDVLRIRLDDEMPTIAARVWRRLVATRSFVLLDGAERLSAPAWLALRLATARAAGLVVTTHGPGRLPTLHECRTSTNLLAGLVAELLGPNALPHDELVSLFAEHGGNIRDALRALYDRHAALPSPNAEDSEQNAC